MTDQLKGFAVLIMSAAQPVTEAIALALAEWGAELALTTATPDGEEALAVRRLAKRITDSGHRALAESADLSLGTNVQIAVRQVAKELGRIDLLIIAPDFKLARPTERLSDAEWAKVMNLNLSGVFYACRSVAREMVRQEVADDGVRGRIILLTPPREALSQETNAAYIAAKAGALALIGSLAREWSPVSISVNAIAVAPDTTDRSLVDAAVGFARRLATADASVTGNVMAIGEV
jgi:NAD(P)-dependent dehydrogenase (short-subunit alcohol dehydrogenase family)